MKKTKLLMGLLMLSSICVSQSAFAYELNCEVWNDDSRVIYKVLEDDIENSRNFEKNKEEDLSYNGQKLIQKDKGRRDYNIKKARLIRHNGGTEVSKEAVVENDKTYFVESYYQDYIVKRYNASDKEEDPSKFETVTLYCVEKSRSMDRVKTGPLSGVIKKNN